MKLRLTLIAALVLAPACRPPSAPVIRRPLEVSGTPSAPRRDFVRIGIRQAVPEVTIGSATEGMRRLTVSRGGALLVDDRTQAAPGGSRRRGRGSSSSAARTPTAAR